ncbi:hypothetical protein QFC21_000572 [Naganishia friedmannii]|uniref:Uncharacterized protein n=1 Tax=Naganishia friedmannii TaxID=89922 RepID=A0ACC2WCP1_9TREE|nr:hypothetical protein QFC21_000572 [Naganishia friedmannii]
MASNYLTRPPTAAESSSTKPAARSTPAPVTESTRLFVGNLSSTVDDAEAQIAALEAKLNAMEHSPLAGRSATPESDTQDNDKGKGKRRADGDESTHGDAERKSGKRTRVAGSIGTIMGLPPRSAGLPAKPSQTTLDTATYHESLKRA